MSDLQSHSRVSLISRIASHCGGGGRPAQVMIGLAVLGLTAAAIHAAFIEAGLRRFMLAYLVAFAFILSLSLGAMFFLLIQHLTRAGWSVLVRRPAEAMSANIIVVAILFLPIAFSVLRGGGEVYPWARSAASVHDVLAVPGHAPQTPTSHSQHAAPWPGYEHQQLDHHTLAKRAWLNGPFFIARWGVLLLVWSVIGWHYWRMSVRQDRTRDPVVTVHLEKLAAPAILVFGLTVTLGAFDLLMSLNPHWYSTIFGVYYFAGSVVGALCAMILMIHAAQRMGFLTRAIGESHHLDLGRFLFTFVFFWAYIAFCQYMLIWYANIPETTGWFQIRGVSTARGGANGWSWVALALLLGHFVIPFAGLMSRHVKNRPGWMVFWGIWLLVMHYLDLFWIVMPEWSPTVQFGFIEGGLMLGLLAIFVLTVRARLERHSLVPLGDPRLPASATHETVY